MPIPWPSFRRLRPIALLACCVQIHAANDITVNGDAFLAVTLSDLQGGAGSDFVTVLTFNTTFTLTVTSNGACQISVRRTNASWLTAGDLLVEVKTGESFGPPVLVDTFDRQLLTSPDTLLAQPFELRYKVRNATVKNGPGAYSTLVTYTVTDA